MRITHKCLNCGTVIEAVPKTTKVCLVSGGVRTLVDKIVFPKEMIFPAHKCQHPKPPKSPKIHENLYLSSWTAHRKEEQVEA